MQRTQIYLTDEQRRRIARLADDGGVSQAEIIRRMLDRALGVEDGTRDRLAAVEATAGVIADAPEWSEWLAEVRSGSSENRLRALGL